MIEKLALSIGGTTIPVPSGIAHITGAKAGPFGKGLISLALELMFIVAIILCLFYIVWGGINWIMSGGEKEGIEGARKKITYAIIGLIVTFIAFFLVNIVGGLFGVKLI